MKEKVFSKRMNRYFSKRYILVALLTGYVRFHEPKRTTVSLKVSRRAPNIVSSSINGGGMTDW